MATKKEVLEQSSFGKRVAEDEGKELASYFVETNQWRQIFSGEKDIVFGDKGAGKSAIYSLLVSRIDALFDRNIIIVPGEKPRGTPAFKDLIVDPPTSQQEFVGLWKLYFLSLIGAALRDLGATGEAIDRVVKPLETAKLIEAGSTSLAAMIRGALDYVRNLIRWESVQAVLELDSAGIPKGLGGKITFREPNADERAAGLLSMDTLLKLANTAAKDSGLTVWLALDRLDVAFADSKGVEGNALRALFMVYSDFREYDHLKIKIFLRSDIWGRVTEEGLRETSHVEDQVTIRWDTQTLLNLVIRRFLKNEAIRAYYNVSESEVLSGVERQEELFYRIFPKQVEGGSRQSTTLDWMLGRVKDGTGRVAPRELIHLLAAIKDQQLKMLELGNAEPPGEQLFDRAVFKAALSEVSHARLDQTLLPEYPTLRSYIMRLEHRKTLQTADTLAGIWGCDRDKAENIATQLVEVGFFEQRQVRGGNVFWAPFLYRDALQLVQGAERGAEGMTDEDSAGWEQLPGLGDA
jgi:hypothetical protein